MTESALGPVGTQIRLKLTQELKPTDLTINDDSDKHKGHSGAREGGESHFSVFIVSEAFEGLNRVERQRRVNAILAEELAGPVHALSLKCLTPDEQG